MKNIYIAFISLFIFTLFTQVSFASKMPEFKRFQEKSGKIEYEHRKYSVKAKWSIDSSGKEELIKNLVSYVSKVTIYYWDNYGDIAFEEAYQVSKFGGKPLPERIKLYEMLWKKDRRYYYDVKKNKASYDPFRLRAKCMKNPKLLKTIGCFKINHPKAEKIGTETVVGKATIKYKESAYSDYYLWKGIILKSENFSASPSGVRKDINRDTIAISIDTTTKIDPKIFSPGWLR